MLRLSRIKMETLKRKPRESSTFFYGNTRFSPQSSVFRKWKKKTPFFLLLKKKIRKTLGMKKKMWIWKKKQPPAYYHHVPTLILASKGYLLSLGFDIWVFRVLPMVDAFQISEWRTPLANLRPTSQTKTRKTTIYTIYTKSNARYTKKH